MANRIQQKARDLAQQLTDKLAEARYWQVQAEQQIGEDDKRGRAEAEKARQDALQVASQRRNQEINAADAHYKASVDPLRGQAAALAASLGYAAAPWTDKAWPAWQPASAYSAAPVRIGELAAKSRFGEDFRMPALLPVIGQGTVLFLAEGAARSAATQTMQNIAARLLATIPPGKLRFTFIDPVGLGRNVAAFMPLDKFDKALVGGTAWIEPRHIDEQTSNLRTHIATVNQQYLGDIYTNIEKYNADPKNIAQPYRVLIVFDFPTNFSEDAARRLVSIAQNGPRCGVYTLALVDTTSKQSLYGFNLADLEQQATVIAWDGETWRWQALTLRAAELHLDPAPPADKLKLPGVDQKDQPTLLQHIVKTVGEAAKAANVVRVPFARIAPSRQEWWMGVPDPEEKKRMGTAKKLRVRLGPTPTGNNEQELVLGGAGTGVHALMVGKTGSGKSTLLHTIITNLALTYSPDEMQLYLIDFKRGVEFQSYARYLLPHARVVAIESEREFGLSVLQGIKAELDRRGRLFTAADKESGDLTAYRAKSGGPLPRILLVVDEFQVFFSEDDTIASQATQLLDEIARQGRSFGVHMLLASQTLGGSYSLSRTTVGQMSVRIALQCMDADARLILADDNPAARHLERPGHAIYNDHDGLVDSNREFQVAYLEDQERRDILEQLRAFARQKLGDYPPPLVFEGNAPASIEKNVTLRNLLNGQPLAAKAPTVWLGDPVAIRDAVAVQFRRQSGANLLAVGQNEEAATGLFSAALLALAAQTQLSSDSIYLLDFAMSEGDSSDFYSRLCTHLARPVIVGKRRQMADILTRLADEVQRRLENEGRPAPPLFLLLHGLQRARDLRQEDTFGSFSSFSDEKPAANAAQQFATILRDGPEVGVHTLLWCDTVTNLNRTLDRRLLREFSLRVALQMSAEDSSTLLDTPAAAKLGMNRAYLYSEDEGRLEKFRPYGQPPAEWLASLRKRA